MSIGGLEIPIWVLDWSGSLMVVTSLWFLWHKRPGYWHWSNASLVPYFALFVSTGQYMLAGLQVSYLIFGVHGLLLWRLERLRRDDGRHFAQGPWYAAGWNSHSSDSSKPTELPTLNLVSHISASASPLRRSSKDGIPRKLRTSCLSSSPDKQLLEVPKLF